MSQLLLDERPLVVLPTLVMAVGFERAVILQQIHLLLQQPRNGVEHDGHKWVYGTYEEWCELYFPFWSPEALRKHITKLEQAGYLVSCQLRKGEWDRTKYYRVDTACVGLIDPSPQSVSECHDPSPQDASVRDCDTTSTRTPPPPHYTKTSTKTSTKKTTDDGGDDARARGEVFKVWGENMPGTMTPILADDISDLIAETSAASVIHGITESVRYGQRYLKYVASCARNHASGKEHVPRPSKPFNANGPLTKADRTAQAFANVERMMQEQGIAL